MRPEISEFSYGYAVTEGMVRTYSSGLRAAPIFPSLFQEGQAGGGYDVLIQRRSVPLFLQFKLSECMVRSTALEVKQGKLTAPFYRMNLRPPPSDQHELLLELESSGEQVYYIAPMFHTEEEFNVAYLSGNILKRSIFLRPSAIGTLPDGRRHHVAFRRSPRSSGGASGRRTTRGGRHRHSHATPVSTRQVGWRALICVRGGGAFAVHASRHGLAPSKYSGFPRGTGARRSPLLPATSGQEVRSACGRVTIPGFSSAARVAWSRYALGSTP